jgi:hypothetical protein
LSETDQTTTLHPGSIAAVVVGFAMANLFVPILFGNGPGVWPLVAVFFGIVAAESGLLAFWAVLGPHRLLVRFLSALATEALLLLMLAFGIGVIDGHLPPDVFGAFLLLPLVSLGPQAPIWVFKWIVGCRTASSADGGDRAADAPGLSARQFGLIDILGATTFFAIALGLASSWVKLQSHAAPPGWEPRFWTGMLIVLATLAVWSLFTTLPCVWVAFFTRYGGLNALQLLVCVGVLWTIWIMSVTVIAGGAQPFGLVIGASLLLFSSQMAAMYGCMRLIRACGYEMIRPTRAATATGPATLPEHDGHAQEAEP